MPRQTGFTLIELSIVLVIIALIVGGIVVGRDMIKSSEIRAAIAQLEKYELAANAFRAKYGGIPGDLLNAGRHGFSTSGLASFLGDGVLGHIGTCGDGNKFNEDRAAFFKHLSEANLIDDKIVATAFDPASINTITDYIPPSKLGRGALVMAFGDCVGNYFQLGRPTVTNGIASYAAGAELPVIDVFSIDSKMDDGRPTVGRVVATTDMFLIDTGAAAADNICVNNTPTPSVYNMNTAARGADTECTVKIRAAF